MNSIAQMIIKNNPAKEYPTNLYQIWTKDEDNLLLQELQDNIDIKEIAKIHNRTIGGIIGRQQKIAYNMYLTGATEEEIIRVSRLLLGKVRDTIAKKEKPKSNGTTKGTIIQSTKCSLEKEVLELKDEIRDLKNTVKELAEMIKAIYVFEDS
jgi:hypothetical protein